jgi:hypothetical protein
MGFEMVTFDSAVGCFIVILFYVFRFNSLRGTRSYTTGPLFCCGVVCFVAPFAIIYGIMLAITQRPMLAVVGTMALWLVATFSSIPLLPRLLLAWRGFCHGIARIPDYAYTFRHALSTSAFTVRDEDTVSRQLARFGYLVSDFRAAQATVIQARFLKIAAIMHELEQWALRYPRFMERNAETYHMLQHGFDSLTFRGVRIVKSVNSVNSAIMLAREDAGEDLDDWNTLDSIAKSVDLQPLATLQSQAQTAMGVMIEDLRKDIDFFLDSLLLFVARTVLAHEWTFSRREQMLQAIGFDIKRSAPPIARSVGFAILIAAVFSLAWFSLIGVANERTGQIREAKAITLFSLSLLCNFGLVHYLKRKYAFANLSSSGKLPIVFILTIGFLVAISLLPVRALFDWFQFYPDHKGSIREFASLAAHSIPWSLFPWVTGVVTALLVQESMWTTVDSPQLRRVLDGLVFGTGLAATFGGLWVIHNLGFEVDGLRGVLFETNTVRTGGAWLPYPYSGIVTIFICFAFGFVPGFLVPEEIRKSLCLRQPRLLSSAASSGPSGLLLATKTRGPDKGLQRI